MMGMYTEILVRVTIDKSQTPANVIDILDYMFNPNTTISEGDLTTDDHPFFDCPRWSMVGSCSSYYHHPVAVKSWYDTSGDIYIYSRSDLKNYSNEIEMFFHWINDYTDNFKDECIGYSWYEESDIPTLILKR